MRFSTAVVRKVRGEADDAVNRKAGRIVRVGDGVAMSADTHWERSQS